MSTPITPRAFSCYCGRPVFFRNSKCLNCQRGLGYAPVRRALLALEPVDAVQGSWREAGGGDAAPLYTRCANLDSACVCNWLIEPGDNGAGPSRLCRCCRLTRTLPDLSAGDNAEYWKRIEMAKRRLVSSLIALQLPVQSMTEDPARGIVFDLLHQLPGGARVMTGHDDGVITLDVEEADDARREQRRAQMREPYRTLVGHLRHECGHYYWQRVVEFGGWIDAYRVVFGDERQDYGGSLQRHYDQGPPADWPERHVSAYASSHPWEDWAETWAHYLHMVDTLDTANSFGIESERVELHYERFATEVLAESGDLDAPGFLILLNGWMELTGVMNEMSRSMGMPDFYPFVLSRPAVRKLHFVHRVVVAAAKEAVAAAAAAGGQAAGAAASQSVHAAEGQTVMAADLTPPMAEVAPMQTSQPASPAPVDIAPPAV